MPMLSEPTNFSGSVARTWVSRGRVRRTCRRFAAIVTMCTFMLLAMDPGLAHASEPSPSAPTSAPAMAGSAPPAPRMEGTLTLTGTILWDGLRDRVVRLQLGNNRGELIGTIVAQDAANLAFARAPDGAIVSVPKSEIVGVKMQSPVGSSVSGSGKPIAQRRLDSGRRQFAGAVAMLSLGVPIGFSGTVLLGICASCLYIHLPLLVPGIALIAAGSVSMRRAKQKDAAFRADWGIPVASRMRLAPTLALGRGGGELGFNLRF